MSNDNKNNNKKPELGKKVISTTIGERVCNSDNWYPSGNGDNRSQIIRKSMAGSNSKDALNTFAGSQTEGSNKKDK